MKEKTLVLVKPDAVQRGLVGEIVSRFERTGIKLIAMKMVYASKELAGKHYADDEEWLKSVGEKAAKAAQERGDKLKETPIQFGRKIRKQLMDYISMSPVVAIVLEGHNAVATVRKLVGPTSPEHAAPGTIRGDYSHETYVMADTRGRPIQNLIHASGTAQEALREIPVWFTPAELHAYMRVDESLIYR
ncbi:MAG TPA: nucleoside-diphosphate kinase [Candidatus Nanoarchaeia archaeon]|nr:nucleoside-diphosphate kinase [Candidatus Nanoarchaeia archaeon]